MSSDLVEVANALLTYDEVAERLGVSGRSVWSMVKEKRLPAVRFGGSVRIDPKDLDQFIESAKEGSAK